MAAEIQSTLDLNILELAEISASSVLQIYFFFHKADLPFRLEMSKQLYNHNEIFCLVSHCEIPMDLVSRFPWTYTSFKEIPNFLWPGDRMTKRFSCHVTSLFSRERHTSSLTFLEINIQTRTLPMDVKLNDFTK